MKMKYLLPVLVLSMSTIGLSQTRDQVAKIKEKNNTQKLETIKQDATLEFNEMQQRAIQENIPTTIVDDSGRYSELYFIKPDGTPLYISDDNLDAGITTRTNFLHPSGGLGLNLEGENMTAHVFEIFSPRLTHQEFGGTGGNNRVVQGDNGNQIGDHATHVTGTIAAAGIDSSSKGMAPKAMIRAFTASSDRIEAAEEAENGMLISNHSYGFISSFLDPDDFGGYSSVASKWDEIMYNAPYYLQVKSAGNDGLDNTTNSAPLNGNANFDKLTGFATAKNNLVIANYWDASIDSNGVATNSFIRNSMSSEGPTDDLRIKPDLAGNGTGLYSPISSSDNAYASFSGTSMSAPNVSGTLLLLQEHYNNTNGTFMRASTLKGLVLHTADNAYLPGPDALSGWGMLNAKKAAETISNNGASTLIEEIELYNSQSYTITVEASGLEDLMASISWTDVPGNVKSGINNTSPDLINDLDIRIKQDGTSYEPYKLLSETTNGTGDNDRDPYERIDVDNPTGVYTIVVTHKGSLINDIQAFSLIITGIDSVVEAGKLSKPIITEFPYFESFENGLATWTQSNEDELDWELNSGSTPTQGTGPDNASDGNIYAFVESTPQNGSVEGQVAHLNSPKFAIGTSSNAAIAFDYHNYGTGNLGQSKLLLRISSNCWTTVWTAPTSPTSEWLSTEVDLTSLVNCFDLDTLELRFERLMSSSQVADFAIDDIVVNIGAAAVSEPQGYCDITYTPEGEDNFYEWIGSFSVGDLVNSSGPSVTGYTDYSEDNKLAEVLQPNAVKSISISPEWAADIYPEDYAIYIDYNRDGDFTDTNELVFTEAFTDAAVIGGTFTVPSDISYGRSRLRVIMHWDIIQSPCGPFEYGEAEDYTVILDGTPNHYGFVFGPAFAPNSGVQKTESNNRIHMFPNPVDNGVLNVTATAEEATNYSIYNSMGQVVVQGKYTEQIDVSGLSTGMYLIELRTNSEQLVERFYVE